MAEVITRFKIETTQYDSKLREAARSLSDLSRTATQASEGFSVFTQKSVDAARALGTTATSTGNAKQRVQELVSAYNEAARAYNQLSDQQKNSDWAQALSQSLEQLQQRIRSAKAEMQGMSNMPQPSAGGGLSGGTMAVFSGNVYARAAELGVQAMNALKNAIIDVVTESTTLATQAEGVRMAYERLGNPELMNRLKEATHGTVSELELMKAAVQFNDFGLPVEELGTMLAFAQQKARDTGQSVDYMVNSIVTGLGRKSLMILDNLGLSATQIKARMKDGGDMTKAVGEIIREQMSRAGDYVETAADRAARAQADVNDQMMELGRTMAPLTSQGTQMWNDLKVAALQFANDALKQVLNFAQRVADAFVDLYNNSSFVRVQMAGVAGAVDLVKIALQNLIAPFRAFAESAVGLGKVIKGALSFNPDDIADGARKMVSAYGNAMRTIASNSGKAWKVVADKFSNALNDSMSKVNIFGGSQSIITDDTKASGGGGSGGSDDKKTKSVETEYQRNQRIIGELSDEFVRASEDRRAAIVREIAALQRRNREIEYYRNLAQGKGDGIQLNDVTVTASRTEGINKAFRDSPLSMGSINTFSSGVRQQINETDLGSVLYEKLTERLRDATTMSSLIRQLMSMGIQGADLKDIAKNLQQQLLSPDGIDQNRLEEWLEEELNGKLIEAGRVPLKINADTGEVSQDTDRGKKGGPSEFYKGLSDVSGKLSTLSGGLSSINTGMKNLGIDLGSDFAKLVETLSAVSSVVSGVTAIVSLFQTPAIAANTYALNANTAATILSGGIPFFANGGVVRAAGGWVGGNNYSGDRVPAMLNSGELVLNSFQQNALAGALEGNPVQNIQLEAVIGAEEITLVTNNRGRRTQRGEFVQSNNRRW